MLKYKNKSNKKYIPNFNSMNNFGIKHLELILCTIAKCLE